jgi:hypothetical protein
MTLFIYDCEMQKAVMGWTLKPMGSQPVWKVLSGNLFEYGLVKERGGDSRIT